MYRLCSSNAALLFRLAAFSYACPGISMIFVEHGFDVLLHDASLVAVDFSDVILDDALVGSAEL
jgi:hypothetical protein